MKKLSIIIIFLVLVINGVYANNLKIGVQSFQNIDPIVTTGLDDYQVISSIYDTLILFTDGELLPQLAIKWEWLSDKELRVQLRKGVKWHNGKLFSAEDVKYSFDRMKPYKTGYSWFFKAIENTKIINNHEIIFILNNPDAQLPWSLASVVGSIVPKLTKSNEIDFKKNAIGTGPFKFVEWKIGEQITLSKYNNYWGKVSEIENVVFKPVADENARLLSLRSGELDVIRQVSPDSIPLMKKSSKFGVYPALRHGSMQLAFNFNGGPWNKPDEDPFKDVMIRKAISFALNYEELIALSGGLSPRVYGPVPPTLKGYPKDERTVERYDFNLELAKGFMAQSSLPNGFSTVLMSPPEYERESVLVKEHLKAININVELRVLDWGAIIPLARDPKVRGTDFGMFYYGRSSLTPFPPGVLQKNLSTYGWKPNMFFDIGFDRLFGDVQTLPIEDQLPIYAAAHTYAVDRRISAWIYQWSTTYGYSSNKIANFESNEVWALFLDMFRINYIKLK